MVTFVLLAPDIVCVALCLVAAVLDLRTRRIPNWLTVSGILAGLVINTTGFSLLGGIGVGLEIGALSAIAGGLLLFLVFGFLGLIRFVGMGDVKLMAAVGALLRWPVALWALAYVAIAGGVIALLWALGKGWLGGVLSNLLALGKRMVVKPQPEAGAVELHRIPYALAILVGATWAAAIKYFPVLRVP